MKVVSGNWKESRMANQTELSRSEKRHFEAKERILKVAYQLFIVESKYEDVTIREIARQADISTGFFYLCFKNKTSIFAELCRVHFEDAIKQLYENINTEKIGFNRLKVFVDFNTGIYFNRDGHRLNQLLKIVLPIDSDESAIQMLLHQIDAMYDILTDILIAGKNDGSIKYNEPPRKMAVLFFNSLQAFLQYTEGGTEKVRDSLFSGFECKELIDSIINIYFK